MTQKISSSNRFVPQLKMADMTSMAGVGLIGLGLGAAMSEHLVGVIPVFILLGIVLHGLGMYGKFEIEREHVDPPTWVIIAFGICSIILILTGLYIMISRYVVIFM